MQLQAPSYGAFGVNHELVRRPGISRLAARQGEASGGAGSSHVAARWIQGISKSRSHFSQPVPFTARTGIEGTSPERDSDRNRILLAHSALNSQSFLREWMNAEAADWRFRARPGLQTLRAFVLWPWRSTARKMQTGLPPSPATPRGLGSCVCDRILLHSSSFARRTLESAALFSGVRVCRRDRGAQKCGRSVGRYAALQRFLAGRLGAGTTMTASVV